MKQKILILMILVGITNCQNPVLLERWAFGIGKKLNQSLGQKVKKIIPNSYMPYKMSVSDFENSGLYTISSNTDTTIKKIIYGSILNYGDLNNDGYIDIVSGHDTIKIFWGNSNGLDTNNPLIILKEYNNKSYHLNPQCVGDINNDGRDDLIITAVSYPNLAGIGKVYIYLNPIQSPIANYSITGDGYQYFLGQKVEIGDINNDGLNDLIVKGGFQRGGPPHDDYGYINIYLNKHKDSVNTKRDLQIRGNEYLHRGLACFDVNGDGIKDILFTDEDTTTSYGTRYINIYYGGRNFDTLYDYRLVRPDELHEMGMEIENAGDMNGDGYDDIATSDWIPNKFYNSYLYIYSGGPKMDSVFDAYYLGNNADKLGYSISTLGDVTGDGLADIVVGAPGYQWYEDVGMWVILKGSKKIFVKVEDEDKKVDRYILKNIFPNPFNITTTISFRLKDECNVNLEIYNILGQKILTLINKDYKAGEYSIKFDGRELVSGTYFCKLQVNKNFEEFFTDIKKIILIK